MECPICYEEKLETEFYEISLGIVGGESQISKIVKDGCKCCLSASDINIIRRETKIVDFSYEIKRIAHYEKIKYGNYAKKILGDVVYDRGEVADILIKEGFLKSDQEKTSERGKAAKNFISKRVNAHFPDFKRMPKFGYTHPTQRRHTYRDVMTDSDMKKIINILNAAKGFSKFKYNKKNNLDEKQKQVNKLVEEGYCIVNKNNNKSLSFRENLDKKLRPCLHCGEILSIGMFPESSWKCLECRREHGRDRYLNLSEEEKEKCRETTRAYRKTEKGKASVKKSLSRPEQKARRTVRRRSKVYIKLLQDTVEGKDHKRLNTHYKGLGCNGGFWKKWVNELVEVYGLQGLEYGSGENGDHKACYHMDHVFPITKFWDYYPLFMQIVGQCDFPRLPWKGHENTEITDLIHEGIFLNLRPMDGFENMSRSNRLCCEEINEHFSKTSRVFPELFPNGYEPIKQEDWDLFEKGLKTSRTESFKESAQLDLDLV